MTRENLVEIAVNVACNTINIKPLYYCSARICLPPNNEPFISLLSYNTCVAVYSFEHNAVFAFGYYSRTTVQHIAKFRNWLRDHYSNVNPNIVHLYKDSSTGKRADLVNRAYDYENIIKMYEIED